MQAKTPSLHRKKNSIQKSLPNIYNYRTDPFALPLYVTQVIISYAVDKPNTHHHKSVFPHKPPLILLHQSKPHNYEKSPQIGIVTKCDILYLCSQNKNKLK